MTATPTEDFALEVDSTTCTAPGYEFNSSGAITEDFDAGTLPDGLDRSRTTSATARCGASTTRRTAAT